MKAKPRGMTQPSGVSNDFTLENFLPYRLSVVASRVSRLFGRHFAESFGLSIPEWRVLSTVGRFGTLSPSAIADRAEMDKVKVSRAAAALVARGLLRRSADPHDGRGRLLRLTRKGISVHDGMVPMAQELESALSQGLGTAQWRTLHRTLVRLERQLGAVDADDDGVAEE